MYYVLFKYDRLPLIFNDFFKSINKVHQYQARLASKISYYLPKARTNYGKFNIHFFGAKVWNSIEESPRVIPVLKTSKEEYSAFGEANTPYRQPVYYDAEIQTDLTGSKMKVSLMASSELLQTNPTVLCVAYSQH